MDFKEYVDRFESMTCILSIKKLKDGGYGDIRIVAGNKAYIESIENPEHMSSSSMLYNKFIPNSSYEKYIPKDLNFEDLVYNCAVKKKIMHAYTRLERYNFWINMVMMPLKSEDSDTEYCSYSMELTTDTNADMMANTSIETASAVIKICIQLRSTDDFSAAMKKVIADIRDLCSADQCCILLADFKNRSCSVLAESIFDKTRKRHMDNYINDNFFDIVESWKNTIAGSSCLVIQNEKDMQVLKERNPLWYDSLSEANVKNVVLFPLNYNNKTLGYIWASNFDTNKTVQIRETLELTAYLLASEISNNQLFKRLKVLSTMDMLTGVLNRNEMNNRVDYYCHPETKEKKSIGIIFADLNGLKLINDTQGHEAGDSLLKTASKILKNVFKGYEIFRAGGDEFMIILPDTSLADIENLVKKLKKESDKTGTVSFATGFSIENDSKNIRSALKHADELMYEDKKRFYDEFPEKKMH